MLPRTPDPQQRVCLNCRFLLWMVGIGQGVQCVHPANETDGKFLNIPYRSYSCEHFSKKRSSGQRDSGSIK
jgi:hypothetical protein